mmetsp:Transcript_24952/g.76958  ORF Transcript_24952/g.76958 Transcript_24952/m.76958 type:complete len:323 (-) Transcript_24952:45-1013(-)
MARLPVLLLVVDVAQALRAPPAMLLRRKAVAAPAKRTLGRFFRNAPVVSPVAVAAAPPLLPAIGAACALPTCLGFWKREYGVSYAYGLAISASAALALKEASTEVARAHALVHVAYGARLCLFLLWRETSVPRFQKLREKIERSAPTGSRLNRAPFVAGCSLLYYLMSLPVVMSARAAPVAGLRAAAAKTAVGLAWAGFLLAAAGDAYKSVAKRSDPSALVTGGPFALLAHPNYQGEQLLWTASTAAGLALAPLSWASAASALGALVGLAGINFVLVQATTGLNARHRATYGDDPKFRAWTAWKGVEFAATPGPPTGVSELY